MFKNKGEIEQKHVRVADSSQTAEKVHGFIMCHGKQLCQRLQLFVLRRETPISKYIRSAVVVKPNINR